MVLRAGHGMQWVALAGVGVAAGYVGVIQGLQAGSFVYNACTGSWVWAIAVEGGVIAIEAGAALSAVFGDASHGRTRRNVPGGLCSRSGRP